MILKNNVILNLISTLENKGVIKGIKKVEFKKNQNIVSANKYLKQVYIIKTGVAKCVINEENDKNFLIEFLGEGEIIGEIEAILGFKTMTTVVAMTEIVAFNIELSSFKELLTTNREFNNQLLAELANRLRLTGLRSSYQQLNTIENSLSKILHLLKEQSLEISKKELAEYLGISLRSLNRELHKLSNTPKLL